MGGGPWKCPVCPGNKGFKKWKHLQDHASSKGHSLHFCVDCHQCFIAKTALVAHQSSMRHGPYQQASSTGFGITYTTAGGPATISAAKSNAVPTAATQPPPSKSASFSFTTQLPAGPPPPSVPRWRCVMCDISFPSEVVLGEHYKASFMHPSCGMCGKSCFNKDELSTVSGNVSR